MVQQSQGTGGYHMFYSVSIFLSQKIRQLPAHLLHLAKRTRKPAPLGHHRVSKRKPTCAFARRSGYVVWDDQSNIPIQERGHISFIHSCGVNRRGYRVRRAHVGFVDCIREMFMGLRVHVGHFHSFGITKREREGK